MRRHFEYTFKHISNAVTLKPLPPQPSCLNLAVFGG